MRWWCITPLFALIAAESQSTSSLGLSKFLTGRMKVPGKSSS